MISLLDLCELQKLLRASRRDTPTLNAHLWNLYDNRPLRRLADGGWGKVDPYDSVAVDRPPDYLGVEGCAMALIEDLRPDWCWSLRKINPGIYEASIDISMSRLYDGNGETHFYYSCMSRPLAICVVLVDVMVAEMTKKFEGIDWCP